VIIWRFISTDVQAAHLLTLKCTLTDIGLPAGCPPVCTMFRQLFTLVAAHRYSPIHTYSIWGWHEALNTEPRKLILTAIKWPQSAGICDLCMWHISVWKRGPLRACAFLKGSQNVTNSLPQTPNRAYLATHYAPVHQFYRLGGAV